MLTLTRWSGLTLISNLIFQLETYTHKRQKAISFGDGWSWSRVMSYWFISVGKVAQDTFAVYENKRADAFGLQWNIVHNHLGVVRRWQGKLYTEFSHIWFSCAASCWAHKEQSSRRDGRTCSHLCSPASISPILQQTCLLMAFKDAGLCIFICIRMSESQWRSFEPTCLKRLFVINSDQATGLVVVDVEPGTQEQCSMWTSIKMGDLPTGNIYPWAVKCIIGAVRCFLLGW